MIYKKYAKILKRADPRDAATEIMGQFADESNSLKEFFQKADREIEEHNQHGDMATAEFLEEYKNDRVTVNQFMFGNIEYRLTEAVKKLFDQENDEELKQNSFNEVYLFIRRIIEDFESETVMKLRDDFLANPDKIDKIIEQLFEKAKKT